jgi:xanthine/CO dehydrogenase XdhC/CoxF family maturation factor
MPNRINQLIEHWYTQKDTHQWVLATIIATDGSSYRKAGAMMLINDLGQYFGMLSGGCLESDIMLQARRCWQHGHNRMVKYDMREEEDLAWKLGIGCGGMVEILLQPISASNHYLDIISLQKALQQGHSVTYRQNIGAVPPDNQVTVLQGQRIKSHNPQVGLDETYFEQTLYPAPSVAIFGGGQDAIPLVAMGKELGWSIVLIEPRPAYAKAQYFDGVRQIIRQPIEQLSSSHFISQLRGAIIMTHNIELDAKALLLTSQNATQLEYLGVLGPTHRTARVLAHAGMSVADLPVALASPMGLDLGGELPESIALSIIAEVHALLEGGSGQSISGVL